MQTFWQQIVQSLPKLTWLSVLDILIVAFLTYQFLMIIRGRRAAHILYGVAILAGIYAVSVLLGLQLLSAILSYIAPYAPFAIIVMFQSEIRRLLARIGRSRIVMGGKLQKRELAEEIVLACTKLAAKKTGALIVLERDIGLRTFIESGVRLDACLSSDLLMTVFHTGSVLHDGAVIVQGDRVAAAACFLPLSVRPVTAVGKMGTRHRAGIGVTEETDCLSVIVSEETGNVSVAAFGEIEMKVSEQRLTERINEHIIQRRWTRNNNVEFDVYERRLERQTTHDAQID